MKERNRVIAELPRRMPEGVMAMAYQEFVNNNEVLAASALGQALGMGQPPAQAGAGGGGGAMAGPPGAAGLMGGPPAGAPPGIGMLGSPGMQAPGQGLENYDTSQFGMS